MELFGLHIPDAAAAILYVIAVAFGLLACVRRGYLWGKWKWYLLALAITYVAACLERFSAVAETAMALALVFVFGKWRKVSFTPLEWFLMALFAYPALFSLCVIMLVIWVEVLRLPV